MIPAMTGSALPTRPLGRSGLAITRVGFGAWAAGGGGWSFGWGPQDDEDSLAAMRRAIERGVNWIDTGRRVRSSAIRRSDRTVPARAPSAPARSCFTKCGLIWDEKNPMVQSRRVLQPESIARECEASLRRLGVERIDLYQFHWPDQTGTAVEDSWAAMARLVEQGKVRAIGVSNFGPDLLERCESAEARGLAAAAVLADPARRRGARDPVVRGPRNGRDRLQPHAVRHPHRPLRRPRAWRAWLRTTGGAVPRSSRRPTSIATSPCATRCAPSRGGTR
jgi:aryl-alcohol dehydrogenase-like predicted oxidoreductase